MRSIIIIGLAFSPLGTASAAAAPLITPVADVTRVAALGPAIRKREQEFANEPAPEFEAEIDAIMTATLIKFKAAKK